MAPDDVLYTHYLHFASLPVRSQRSCLDWASIEASICFCVSCASWCGFHCSICTNWSVQFVVCCAVGSTSARGWDVKHVRQHHICFSLTSVPPSPSRWIQFDSSEKLEIDSGSIDNKRYGTLNGAHGALQNPINMNMVVFMHFDKAFGHAKRREYERERERWREIYRSRGEIKWPNISNE